ncbi:MAG: recombinase zinc beta ribbon domain-containing protein, partial [Planctomycetia bacterium]|nr:recombinase zinc beta ribbon domain-containing protein [Planctomycetia bacterium]
WNRAGNSRFMEYCDGHVQGVNGQKNVRKRLATDWLCPEKPEYRPLIAQETWDKVQVKAAALHDKYRAPTTAPRTAELWLRGLVVCGWCGKPMRAYVGSKTNNQPPGYSCSGYMQHGKRNPHGCKQHHVPHEFLERLVLDYLTTTAPEVKSLLDAAEADDLEAARPLLDAIESARQELGGVWCEMVAFVADYFQGSKARRKAERKLSIEELYSASYRHVRPQIEKAVAAKESELESLLDSFAGLSPKLKERANRRGEALQEEIDALKRDLGNLRITWDRIKEDLRQRKAALDHAVSTLNEEGRHRQKAEAVRTVVDRIVCHFQSHGNRHKLTRIEVAASEDGAIQPRTFPEPRPRGLSRLSVPRRVRARPRDRVGERPPPRLRKRLSPPSPTGKQCHDVAAPFSARCGKSIPGSRVRVPRCTAIAASMAPDDSANSCDRATSHGRSAGGPASVARVRLA